jgi:hypothetical protein
VYSKNLIVTSEWWLYDGDGSNATVVTLPAETTGFGARVK